MNQSLSFFQTIGLPLMAGVVPAVVSGIWAVHLARRNFGAELHKIQLQLDHQQRGQMATLRQTFISPLRYWASKLSKRLQEIEAKFEQNEYGQVHGWFESLKNHTTGHARWNDFQAWCYYEGIFTITTLYYTCSYLQSAREIAFRSPFSELNPDYSEQLDAHLSKVAEALGGIEGIWDSTQEALGERFTRDHSKIDNKELCRILDSQDVFELAPFLRVIDVYLYYLNVDRVRAMRAALEDLTHFLNSRATPETMRDARSMVGIGERLRQFFCLLRTWLSITPRRGRAAA
jgi:hypothetical protein